MRESKVVERLSKSTQNEIANVAKLFLGLIIGSTMNALSLLKLGYFRNFLVRITCIGLDTIAGIIFAKFISWLKTRED